MEGTQRPLQELTLVFVTFDKFQLSTGLIIDIFSILCDN